ncbi:hypothetical protein [Simplicispira suum]|uniref:Uncharacterized protein n=1 Tax=Simplicispira suum TaxID=2109915 RepID=A0A2S0N5V1_9BURK|nr:hypothetical protein [Simplicispira suum]AVO43486.1 hypothetical protein C6571_18865 [Simplicispira suum]
MTNQPVQPGHIRLVKLKVEGRLQVGDQVETSRLGVCTVLSIQSADSIIVTTSSKQCFNLSGLGFRARVVQATTA